MRRGFSRFLLVVLAVLAVLVLVRTLRGPSEPDAMVAFGTRWEPEQLRHRVFELDRPLRIAVTAVGSFETPVEGVPDALAAYGWIMSRATRDTAWVMTAGRAANPRMTLATVDDTLALAAGTYDALFTTYGDPLRPAQEAEGLLDRARAFLQGDRFAWHADAERWRFRIDPVAPDSAAFARELDRDLALKELRPPAGAVWTTGPVTSHVDSVIYLDVPAATRVWVDATGEIFDEASDYGWLDDLATDERVWTMTKANTTWAGGSLKNRRFRDTLRLEAGRYRLGFRTDGSHAYLDWTANPPFNPATWGLVLGGGGGTVRPLRPFTDLPEIAALREVGDDALHTARFTLSEPTLALVWALGELRDDERYDYARLLREAPPTPSGPAPPTVVWEMEHADSRHGGGTERNRLVEQTVRLETGTYLLRFQTDGSHSPEDWHGSAPDHPERWGVTLFALGRDFDPTTVTDLAVEHGARSGTNVVAEAPPPPPDAPDVPDALAASEAQPLPLDARRLVNSQRLALPFELDAATTLRIQAVGEISGASRYDYAWIARANDGAIVWEMTAENTEPAGGAPRNRRFEGTVTLDPGTYVLRVRSDDSHAFGDFVSDPPEVPEAWGVLVEESAGE